MAGCRGFSNKHLYLTTGRRIVITSVRTLSHAVYYMYVNVSGPNASCLRKFRYACVCVCMCDFQRSAQTFIFWKFVVCTWLIAVRTPVNIGGSLFCYVILSCPDTNHVKFVIFLWHIAVRTPFNIKQSLFFYVILSCPDTSHVKFLICTWHIAVRTPIMLSL